MKVLIGPNVMGLEKGIPALKQAHPRNTSIIPFSVLSFAMIR